MWITWIIMGILSISIGFFGFKKGWFRGYNPPLMKKILIGIGSIMLMFGILSTSFVVVPTKHTAHLIKKYGSELENNRVIAINGERGRQSRLLQEGLNFSPFIRVIYNIEFVPYEKINEGEVGLLTAVDGSPNENGLYIAPNWLSNFADTTYKYDTIYQDSNYTINKQMIIKYPTDKLSEIETKMLDPKYFIEHNGKKGPQLNVLKPGEYKINKYMWKIDIVPATRIPDGHVGVVISRVGEVPDNIEISNNTHKLTTPVVDKGYMGIWKDVLKPGMYYLNRHPDKNKGAYEVKLIDTRVQTWTYKGGYNYYTIDLEINEDGRINQTKSSIFTAETPSNAADKAIMARSKDAWDIFIDCRILVQIQPALAPYIIASIGGLDDLENKIVTPLIRSVIRNIAENRLALTFVSERSIIEQKIDSILRKKSNIINEFKMNNVYIKPVLLIPDKRNQLATKMVKTYEQEKKAFDKKVETERARELAEHQKIIVEAEVNKKAAMENKEAQYLNGQGTKLRMIEEAKGQAALRDVLGVENTFKLEMASTIKLYPKEAWQVPLFNGGGSGNDAYTAITIKNMFKTIQDLGMNPIILEQSIDNYNKNQKQLKKQPKKKQPNSID